MRIPVALSAVLALLIGQAAWAGPVAASQPYPVSYHSFALSAGQGTALRNGALTLGSSGLTTTSYADPYLRTTRTYDMGSWTSPKFSTGFGFSELVSSRNLDDATRRRQLMSEVNGRSLDVLDQLHAARDDLVVQQAELNKAQALASDRRRAAEAHLADLEIGRASCRERV